MFAASNAFANTTGAAPLDELPPVPSDAELLGAGGNKMGDGNKAAALALDTVLPFNQLFFASVEECEQWD